MSAHLEWCPTCQGHVPYVNARRGAKCIYCGAVLYDTETGVYLGEGRQMSVEEIITKTLELENKPIRELTEKEWGIITSGCLITDAREGFEKLSLRDYCYAYWLSPSYLLKLIRPYLKTVENELRKLGYAKVSKYAWRKWKADIPWDKIRELAERSGLSKRESYVLYVAWKLLRITYPWRRDWKGYNFFHAFAILDRLRKSRRHFSKEDVEWIRQRLVKYYRDQISELGLDLQRLEKEDPP